MALITRSAHPSALWPGIHAWFGAEYGKWEPIYSKIFDVRKSDKAFEEISSMSGFGMASVKSEGQSIVYDTDAEGPKNRFTNVTYGLGYIVSREEIEDSQYTQVSRARAGALRLSMQTTKETVHANIFNRAFSGSYTYGDGVALISNAHPTVSGNQSNLLTAADLSEASLEDAMTTIWAMRNDRGFPIKTQAVRLIIHPSNAFNAQRILKSDLQPGSESNNINALRTMGLIPEVVVNPYLTDPDAWFIQTNVEQGLISFNRRAIELTKDDDFDTENAKAKATERYVAGHGDWRALLGSPGA